MKKNKLLSLLVIVVLFTITGCSKNESIINSNEIKTKLSCSKEFTLFHSKQYVDYVVSLDKDNKLIKYEHIENYYTFDTDNEYSRTCDALVSEAKENNNKEYLDAKAECRENPQEVNTSYEYDVSKLPSKKYITRKEVIEYLNDDYILDLENYKNTMINKSYTCVEK